jgi:hypothetical protein
MPTTGRAGARLPLFVVGHDTHDNTDPRDGDNDEGLVDAAEWQRWGRQRSTLHWAHLHRAVQSLELPPQAKFLMLARVRAIYGYLDRNYHQSRRHYFCSKAFVMVVGILNPALLSITTHTDSVVYTVIFWSVWTLQVLVGIVTAFITLFKWDKRYFVYMLYRNRLEHEVWTYVALTGKYSLINPANDYETTHLRTTHYSKSKRFAHHLELIHRRIVEYDVELESAEDVSSLDGSGGEEAASGAAVAGAASVEAHIADLEAQLASKDVADADKPLLAKKLETYRRILEKNRANAQLFVTAAKRKHRAQPNLLRRAPRRTDEEPGDAAGEAAGEAAGATALASTSASAFASTSASNADAQTTANTQGPGAATTPVAATPTTPRVN